MDDVKTFLEEREYNINQMASNTDLGKAGIDFLVNSFVYKYSYNFDWLGLPIIQFPQDIVAIQEIIWKTKPDIIIELGVARGGSLILSASILHLLNGSGKVIGVDIDIRDHNYAAIQNHPLSNRIHLIQGSSIEQNTVNQIAAMIQPNHRVMVILDSDHTYMHVLKELKLYSPFVSPDCYLIVLDTIIDHMPHDFFSNRPWGKENNPKTAVHEFLKENNRFVIDKTIYNKLIISVAPDGYLKCVL